MTIPVAVFWMLVVLSLPGVFLSLMLLYSILALAMACRYEREGR